MTIIIEYKQNGADDKYDDISGKGEEFTHRRTWDKKYSLQISCCNTLCKSMYTLSEIHAFAEGKETEQIGYVLCNGNETSPKGAKIYRRCANSLRYRFSRVEDTPQYEPE